MSSQSTELSNSWVVVGPENNNEPLRVQDVQEHDSESDSISVISESGGSHKTDEEELAPGEEEVIEGAAFLDEEPQGAEENVQDFSKELEYLHWMRYFVNRAIGAIILLVIAVGIQHYMQGVADVDNFDPEEQSDLSYVQIRNEEDHGIKRRKQIILDDIENKILEGNQFMSSEDNDPKVESNFRPNKNKKCNKENCDDHEGSSYDRKVKELKIKEDYLKEKEKFLIEKEHDLLKKEIKMRKDKEKNNGEKKVGKKDSDDEKKEKIKYHKGSKENVDPKNGKVCKQKEGRDEMKQKKDKKRDGEWYMSLHEARNSMRQKRRFNYKLNKAHWYFQWMVDRARLRGK